MMTFIGIDPGLSGAIAAILPDGRVEVADCPTFRIESNKNSNRQESDIIQMRALLSLYARTPCHVVLEKVHGMPKQSGAAMFSFGRSYGHWEALLVAQDMPHTKVTPQAWKKAMMPGMAGKDSARIRVMQAFPQSAGQVKRKKDDGRAEAILMAAYCRRMLFSPEGGQMVSVKDA